MKPILMLFTSELYIKSLNKKIEDTFSFFYGIYEVYLFDGINDSFFSGLKEYLKDPGLLGYLTFGILPILEYCCISPLKYLFVSVKELRSLFVDISFFIFSMLILLPFMVVRLLVSSAALIPALFFIIPYHYYEYSAASKPKNQDNYIVKYIDFTNGQHVEKNFENLPPNVFSAKKSLNKVINFNEFHQSNKLNNLFTFIEDKKNDAIFNKIKVNLEPNGIKTSKTMFIYSAESKQYLSRLIWLGILAHQSQEDIIKKTFLVKKEPVITEKKVRLPNKHDRCNKCDEGDESLKYFFIALFANINNLPEVLVRIIAGYIFPEDAKITLSHTYNHLQVHTKENAHLFFIYQAKQLIRIKNNSSPQNKTIIKNHLSEFSRLATIN